MSADHKPTEGSTFDSTPTIPSPRPKLRPPSI